MSFTLTCYTLFDVTYTGVGGYKHAYLNEDLKMWLHKRDTQCNFDTILQAISLRSQPEVTRYPEQSLIKLDGMFGFLFEESEDTVPCWSFDFDIMHSDVFSDGSTNLGLLYNDCDNIPMIKCSTAWKDLPAFLDTSDELRNIYFKVKHV